MTTAKVELPPKLVSLFSGQARYRIAYGGRGSGKTRGFALMSAVKAYQYAHEGTSGVILCGREHLNSLDESSMEEIKQAIRSTPWLEPHFEIGEKFIRTRDHRVSYVFTGLRHNLDSIKSKSRILLAWVDEAEAVSDKAWLKLIPTVREEGSEIWISYNPERETSATHLRFRADPPKDAKITEMNWRDNPWFPDVLNQERLEDKAKRPDQYDHIWEGDFVRVVEGAYFADLLTQASIQGRVGNVMPDPYLQYRVYVDIGGTGAKSDAFALWVVQFVSREIRVLDYYEVVGQPFSAHLAWLRKREYLPANTAVWLPHDGKTHDRVIDVSYESAFRDAGYKVTVIPNQGRGAASARIEAARRLFPMCWFNETTTKPGRDALGWYHEKRDEQRNIGLGPEHDWSSHGCLVAGTLIKTRQGQVPVETVNTEDEVLTPAGWAPVEWSGAVKMTGDLIEITLADGRQIVATPEHKIFTTGGVIRANAIGYNDAVITAEAAPCLTLANASKIGYRAAFIESTEVSATGTGRNEASMSRRRAASSECFIARCWGILAEAMRSCRSMATGRITRLATGSVDARGQSAMCQASTPSRSSTASGITATPIAATTPVDSRPASTCTRLCGSTTMARSLMGFMSITRTRTRPITTSTIWSFCQRAIILATTALRTPGSVRKPTSDSFVRPVKRPKHGIAAQKGESGTASMGDGPWPSASVSRSAANIAEPPTSLATLDDPSIATPVASVRHIRRKPTRVYDLTIPLHHCYYAGGMLVSNSDAFGLMAVAYEPPRGGSEPDSFEPDFDV